MQGGLQSLGLRVTMPTTEREAKGTTRVIIKLSRKKKKRKKKRETVRKKDRMRRKEKKKERKKGRKTS
jgi:hypothetical protein